MFNLVLLLVTAAVVSLQCGLEANAQRDNKQLENNLNANVVPSHKSHPRKVVTMLQHPPTTARFSRSPLELSCEVQGSPIPSVQWLKNGEPIADFLDETNEITALYPSNLASLVSTLVVTTANSGDVFTCIGTNGFSTETGSTTIYVEDGDEANLLSLPLFTLPTKPVITKYYTHLFQDIGSNVVLPCRVVSPTEPQVFWQDNANDIIYGNSRIKKTKGTVSVIYKVKLKVHKKMLPSGDLFIPNIRWSDMGEYICTAKNLYGKATAVSFLYPTRPSHLTCGKHGAEIAGSSSELKQQSSDVPEYSGKPSAAADQVLPADAKCSYL